MVNADTTPTGSSHPTSSSQSKSSPSPRLNVIVIGGSSGIGKAIVTRFASEGHNVLATYWSNITDANEIKKKYNRVEYCFLDQGELESVEEFGNFVNAWLHNKKFGEDAGESDRKIDILINNAALGSATVIKYIQAKLKKEESKKFQGKVTRPDTTASPSLLPDQDSEDDSRSCDSSDSQNSENDAWNNLSTLRKRAMEDEALMKVNALGPLWVTEILMPMMRSPRISSGIHHDSIGSAPATRNYATILFMGSVGGSCGVFPEYRASDLMSKAAVTYLSKHLAAEYVRSHVDVICVSPGATNTDMFRKSTLETCADPQLFMDQMPKKRLINPEELADAVFSLTTEKWARIFHGGVLDASLGLGVRPGLQTESQVERNRIFC